jgi:hypothetical protein
VADDIRKETPDLHRQIKAGVGDKKYLTDYLIIDGSLLQSLNLFSFGHD